MRFARAVSVCLCLLVAALPAAAGEGRSWEKLKSLVGDWEGTYEGQPARVSYALVSNGTTLMETLDTPGGSHMITMYHPDGDSLLMTHYCSVGNQPRMRSRGLGEDGRIDFRFVDVTNLGSKDDHRMTRLVLSFPDGDHLAQEWTSTTGNEEHVGRFAFTRRK
jgi:hypothetical protein